MTPPPANTSPATIPASSSPDPDPGLGAALAPRPSVSAILKLLVALGAVSCAPIFIRFSETELSADATVFNRLFIFFLVFGLGQLISSRLQPADSDAAAPVAPTQQQWFLLVAVGAISITSLVLWAISLIYTTVAKSMLLNNLTPLFTSLGAFLFWGQRFDRRFLLGMAIALSGALYLGFEDLTGQEGLLVGDIYATLSAVFLGIYFLLVEQLRSRFSATTILLWRCAVGSSLLLPLVLLQGKQLFPTTPTACLAVLGLGIVSEGMGQRLLADSMAELSSSFVSLFLLLEPVVSALLAWVIFGEALGKSTWIGFAVVLVGIYLAQSSESATKSKSSGDGTIAAPSHQVELSEDDNG
jgi:drug/metabolite transporter (DMT)-like permease